VRVTLGIFAFVTTFFVSGAHACKCLPAKGIEHDFKGADAVFFGKVLGKYREEKNDRLRFKVHIEVYKSWKGRSNKNIVVYTSEPSGACGYPFVEGKEYIIYASETTRGLKWGQTPELLTDHCTRTGEAKKEEIEALDRMN
jgi:hypothetical protein